jgi:hypothetical protein
LNSGETRASRDAMAPVVGTMLASCAYTGRSASSGSVNRCVGWKLRSSVPAWFRLSEYVRSTLALNRLPRIGPFQLTFERTARGALKSEANSVALGAVLANTPPFVPSAHWVGIDDGSCA